MADLNKVMKDMEKATQKLAEMLNDKEEPIPEVESKFVEDEEELTEVEEMAELDDEALAIEEEEELRACEDCSDAQQNQVTPAPCSRIVRFHCIRNIPRGLRLDRVRDFRVVYDPTDLRVCVEEADISVTPPPGCPDLTLTVFAVRVVGCIPVSISALAFKGRCGVNLVPRREEDRKVALCCDTTVCVDNVICYRGTRAEAEAAAAAIQAQLKGRKKKHHHRPLNDNDEAETQHRPDPCDAVPLLFAIGRIFRVPVDGNDDKPKILVFTGAFRLPSCPQANNAVS
jgi:hypothetical protein